MIRTVTETGSTNVDLLAAAQSGAPEGTWLRAERQIAGKGRLGRPWHSPMGNLYASTIVRPGAGDPPAASLALVVGIAVYDVAAAWVRNDGRSLWLKWPNDLLVDGAKLAGILLERSADAVVAGIGVNLAVAPDLPDRRTISLASLAGTAPDPAIFLEDLAAAVARWLRSWRQEGLGVIREAWLAAAHPIGTALAAGQATHPVHGLFDGLDADGNLLLRTGDGRMTINAGDVMLL